MVPHPVYQCASTSHMITIWLLNQILSLVVSQTEDVFTCASKTETGIILIIMIFPENKGIRSALTPVLLL